MYSDNTTLLSRDPRGIFGGVCEGLGRQTGINPNLLRLGLVASIFFFGTGFLAYLVLWWLLPRADDLPIEHTVWEHGPKGRVPALRRTENNRKFLGVCGGLAQRWSIDPSWVRLGAIAALISTGPLAVAAYFVAGIVMPGPTHRPYHPVQL